MHFLGGFLLLISIVLAGCGGIADSSQPAAADDMINAFSQGCNLGPWTRAALDRSNSIVTLYESLRQKASCSGDAGVIDNAIHASQALQSELRAMNADEDLRKERTMEDASNDLLLTLRALDPTADADIRTALTSYYSTTRYQQALAKADVNYTRAGNYRSRLTYGMTNVSSYLRTLITASDQLSNCYARNPSVALEVGANLAELVGSFSSPVVGLGTAAVSKLLQFGVVASRVMGPAESIYQTNKNKMPTALLCGLEALSRDYCKAKDAATLASLSTKQNGEPLPFFRGALLLDKYMPVLNAWLDRVVNGSETTDDPSQADKINLQNQRIQTAKNMKRSVDSYYLEGKKRINLASDSDGKIAEIRRGISNFTGVLFTCAGLSGALTSCPDGPFSGFEDAKKFIQLVVPNGFDASLPGTPTHTDLIQHAILTPTDLPVIKRKVDELFATRYAAVVRDFNEKVNVNASALVRDATVMMGVEEISPMQAMEEIFHFFDQYSYEEGSNGDRDRIIISQLRDMMNQVYFVLQNPQSVDDNPAELPCSPDGSDSRKLCLGLSPAKEAIQTTFNTFKLDKDNVFIPGAITKLVSVDLSTRFRRGEGPVELDQLFRLAGGDLDLLLRRSSLTPASVMADTANARQLSQENLAEFRSRFLPAIKLALRDLKKAADDAKEPPAGSVNSPYRDVLSKLCVLTLITGMEWPKDLDPAVCAGAKLVSREAHQELGFERLRTKLDGLPFHERICSYEEFLRYDRLANLDLKSPSHTDGRRALMKEVEEQKQFWQRYIDLKLGARR